MENLKKIILLLTLISCFMIWVQCVSAEPVISSETNKKTVTVGGIFNVSINANASAIQGIQFDILYDPMLFEYQDSELGNAFDDALVSGIEKSADGKVTLLAAFSEGKSISDKICSVNFKALAGNGKLTISNIKLMVNTEKMSETDFDIEITTKGRPSGGGKNGGLSSSGSVDSNKQQPEKGGDINKDNNEEIKEPSTKEQNELGFDDINGHWAYKSILLMLKEGIISGVGDNKFAPDNTIKRSELACMIANSLNLKEKADNQYTDVQDDGWYTDGVQKCANEKIMLGSDGNFRPNDFVTREEAAAIILRAAKYLELELPNVSNKTDFSDYNEISEWAYESVAEMVKSGFLSGYEDGTIKPKHYITRAQTAVLLSKLLTLQWGNTEDIAV